MFSEDEIYTVSTFLSLCNKTIENNIPTCWLQGEVSNLSRPSSGHWYFSLKDDRGQIRCALFRLNQRRIHFELENGMAILARVAPTIYEPRGDFQIIIQSIEPTGIGSLQLAFEQLKAQLAQQGFFDNKHKKTLPLYPKTIGIISSGSGAVIQDIIKILNKRYPFSNLLLYDTIVQGEGAAASLARAVESADKAKKCDVLILARGGGSLEDLWAFNETILIKAVFHTKTPIVTAIGHETDTTIADFVSDVRAPTPSAAAMLVTPDKQEITANVAKLSRRITEYFLTIQQNYQAKLLQLKLRLPNPRILLQQQLQRLDSYETQLDHQLQSDLNISKTALNKLCYQLTQHSPVQKLQHKAELTELSKYRLTQQVKQLISTEHNKLNDLTKRLEKTIKLSYTFEQSKLASCISGLHHLSPLNTLSRGYSITKNENGQVLSWSNKTKIGQSITTQLAFGQVYSTVYDVKNVKNNT